MMLKRVLKLLSAKINIIFILILLFLVGLRFLWLDKFPVGINHDEIDVILSSKSYIKFGTDLSGISFPKSLFATQTEAGLAGLPSFLMSAYYGFVNLNQFTARIPAVLVSLTIVFLIAFFVYKTTSDRNITLISIFVGLVSPWLFFYGRAPTESPWSLLFLLVGLITFYESLKEPSIKNSKGFYLSLFFFVASFYSYQGAKITIPIFVTLLLFLQLYKKTIIDTKKILSYFFVFLCFIGLFFIYSFKSQSTYGSRSKEIIFNQTDQISHKVDELRRDSIATPLSTLFFNKYTVLFTEMSKKYLYFFNPDLWFFRGDSAVLFEESGLALLPDVFFVLLGIIALSQKQKSDSSKGDMFLSECLMLLVLVAPLSSSVSVNSNQYMFRAFTAIPVLIILVSLGIDYFLKFFKGRATYYYLISLIVIYLVFFANFLNFFFFRYSVSEQENHFLSERVLSSYLSRIEGRYDGEIYVVSPKPYRAYYEYLFFTNKLQMLEKLPKANPDKVSIGNITFQENCLVEGGVIVLSTSSACQTTNDTYAAIQNKKDTGTLFKVYNDRLCSDVNLTGYRRFHLISDYNIENLDNKTFCERWIGKYEN